MKFRFDPYHMVYVSAALFCGAAIFFFSQWYTAPRAEAAEALTHLSETLRATSRNQTPAAVTKSASVSDLLAQIQDIAELNRVEISSLVPVANAPDQLDMQILAGFSETMLFMGRLETLQVGILSFDLAPSETNENVVAATVRVAHLPKNAVPASFADYFDAIVNHSPVRNPFAVGDAVLPAASAEGGDLSWTYHLSSISLLGGERIATIDGKDYAVGDRFNGLYVEDIGPASVSLTGEKASRLVLHFRTSPERKS